MLNFTKLIFFNNFVILSYNNFGSTVWAIWTLQLCFYPFINTLIVEYMLALSLFNFLFCLELLKANTATLASLFVLYFIISYCVQL